MTIVPAPRPCGSCPYRRDVPSGIWDKTEYLKLPGYDEPDTALQPPAAFFCHQQDGRLCAGWVAVHDMENSLGFRLIASMHELSEADIDAVCDYTTDAPLFASGTEAMEHGMKDLDHPARKAWEVIHHLKSRRGRPV